MSQLDLSTVQFTACKSIVTDYEYRIYDILLHKLEQDYPNQYVICPKVRIVDIVNMDNEDDFGLWQRIKSRHVDFLICTKELLKPILAVELQDSTHKTGKGRYRDMLVSNVFKSAGIELLQLWTTNIRDVEDLLYRKIKSTQEVSSLMEETLYSSKEYTKEGTFYSYTKTSKTSNISLLFTIMNSIKSALRSIKLVLGREIFSLLLGAGIAFVLLLFLIIGIIYLR